MQSEQDTQDTQDTASLTVVSFISGEIELPPELIATILDLLSLPDLIALATVSKASRKNWLPYLINRVLNLRMKHSTVADRLQLPYEWTLVPESQRSTFVLPAAHEQEAYEIYATFLKNCVKYKEKKFSNLSLMMLLKPDAFDIDDLKNPMRMGLPVTTAYLLRQYGHQLLVQAIRFGSINSVTKTIAIMESTGLLDKALKTDGYAVLKEAITCLNADKFDKIKTLYSERDLLQQALYANNHSILNMAVGTAQIGMFNQIKALYPNGRVPMATMEEDYRPFDLFTAIETGQLAMYESVKTLYQETNFLEEALSAYDYLAFRSSIRSGNLDMFNKIKETYSKKALLKDALKVNNYMALDEEAIKLGNLEMFVAVKAAYVETEQLTAALAITDYAVLVESVESDNLEMFTAVKAAYAETKQLTAALEATVNTLLSTAIKLDNPELFGDIKKTCSTSASLKAACQVIIDQALSLSIRSGSLNMFNHIRATYPKSVMKREQLLDDDCRLLVDAIQSKSLVLYNYVEFLFEIAGVLTEKLNEDTLCAAIDSGNVKIFSRVESIYVKHDRLKTVVEASNGDCLQGAITSGSHAMFVRVFDTYQRLACAIPIALLTRVLGWSMNNKKEPPVYRLEILSRWLMLYSADELSKILSSFKASDELIVSLINYCLNQTEINIRYLGAILFSDEKINARYNANIVETYQPIIAEYVNAIKVQVANEQASVDGEQEAENAPKTRVASTVAKSLVDAICPSSMPLRSAQASPQVSDNNIVLKRGAGLGDNNGYRGRSRGMTGLVGSRRFSQCSLPPLARGGQEGGNTNGPTTTEHTPTGVSLKYRNRCR